MLKAKGRSSSSGQSGGKVENVARVVLLSARRRGIGELFPSYPVGCGGFERACLIG